MRHNLLVVDSLSSWGKFLSAQRALLTTTEIERLYWGALCCNTINIVGAGSAEISQCCRNLQVLQKVCRVFQKICRYCRKSEGITKSLQVLQSPHALQKPPPHPTRQWSSPWEKSTQLLPGREVVPGQSCGHLAGGEQGGYVSPVILLVFTICWLDKIVSGGYISFLVRITAVYF